MNDDTGFQTNSLSLMQMNIAMSFRNQGRIAMAPSSALESHFDPIQLLGSEISFTDHFADDDDNNLWASLPSGFTLSSSTLLHNLSDPAAAAPASSQEAERTPAFQLLEIMPLQCTLSLLQPGHGVYPEHPQAAAEPERDRLGVTKLTPGQAVHIFKLGKTKTHRTAGMLAVEYGVTAKAIRDIWRSRSWVRATRALNA
jgi:hypothetical protein